jgi:hypothetical protein
MWVYEGREGESVESRSQEEENRLLCISGPLSGILNQVQILLGAGGVQDQDLPDSID